MDAPETAALPPWQQQVLAHWHQLLAALPPSGPNAWDAPHAAPRPASAATSTSAAALPACLLACSDAAGGPSLARLAGRASCGGGGGGGGAAGRGACPEWRTTTGSAAARRAPLLASLTASAAAVAARPKAREAGQAKPGAAAGGGGGQAAKGRELSGTWIKDREKSCSMEGAMNLMHLNGIVRQAVKLVRGVRIEQDPAHFTFTVFSFISWFKVKEVYPMSGEERQFRRRDLRRGKATGWVEPHGEHLHVQLRWNDPFGGEGTDHFRLFSEDELHIESVLQVAGQTARYLTVYRRKHDRGTKQEHGGGRADPDHLPSDDHHHHTHQEAKTTAGAGAAAGAGADPKQPRS